MIKQSSLAQKLCYFTAFLLLLFAVACQSNRSSAIHDEDEKDKYDGPEQAARYEFERTKDPATGKVPRERLQDAINRTIQSKNSTDNGTSRIAALSWIERGPTSDVPGPSNGNTRANSGLASGRIRAVMVDSNDATHRTVLIGSVSGGLWKTTDITTAPANWTVVNDNLGNLAIAAICQDPRPGFTNIMYFCTGESYYNIDAVRGNGVYKSVDGGATWSFLASTSSYLNCTRILCDFQGNIYLATRGTGLLRSTAASGGAAWTNITPTGFTDICDLEISSTSAAGRLHVVTGVFTTQAYRYTDIPATVTAATWTSPAVGFPSFLNRAEIAVSGNTLYACPADGTDQVPTIYKSTNGGANWAATGGQPTAGWASGQGWYSLSVGINPANANECIVGGLDCWKTTNGGTTWTQISNWVGLAGQYVHADQHNLVWYDGGSKLIFACDGGIHYSADNGVTIRDRNQGLRIKQFYSVAIHPSTTNYFIAGAQDNGMHQFSNPGLSTSVEFIGGDGAFCAIDQNEPQFQFGSYVFNIYRRSTNSGATWSTVSLNTGTGQFINPFDYDNVSNIMYCGDVAGTYRRWTDPQTGSATAVVSVSNLSGSVTTVSSSPYTTNRVYFGTSNGKVIQVDAANTFVSGGAGTDRSTGLPAGTTVSCVTQGTDDNNLIAVLSNYGVTNVWVSTNGGASWTASDGNLPDMPVRWALFYPGDNSKAYIATETGVWETTSLAGGATVWTANSTFPTVRTDMIRYRSSDRTIAAATHGRGLWTAIIPNVTTPDIQFQNATDAQTETTVSTSGCRGYKDYTYNMTIANPPTGTATVTLGVAGGGSATQNIDYSLVTTSLVFANGSTTPQPFTVRIFDDAAVESAETFTLNYSISGTTNAQAGVSNQTFTFTINDNDAAPLTAASLSGTIGTYNTNLTQPFRGAYFDARTQMLYSAAELTGLGFSAGNITSVGFNVVTKSSTQPYTGFTIKLKNTATAALGFGAFETGATQVFTGNYSTVAGLNTIPITPFAWDGVSNLLVDICWDNATGTVDDLVQGTTLNANCYFDRQNTNATPGCNILNNVFQFTGGARPLITLAITTSGTPISTVLNSTRTAYLGPNNDVYFYDGTANIMARVRNLTSFDYGCTQLIIDRAGVSSAQFWNATPANYLASKSVKFLPTNSNPNGSLQITLYYTTAEVTGWQTATGQAIANSKLARVSNGFFVPDVTAASPHLADVIVGPSANVLFGTAGYTLTGTFTNTSTGQTGFGMGYPCSPTLATVVWTGAVNTTWSNAGNWSCGVVPGPTSDVVINGGLTNYPTVSSNVVIKSLTVKPGASVTVATGFNLTTQ